MGSPDEERDREAHEGPVRSATISTPIFVGKTEVTDKQFRDVMGTSPSRTAMKARTPDPHPVDSVTWLEAVEFCKTLTQRDRKLLPRGWEYRLPTEAEWEYACRAGTTGPYSFGLKSVPMKQAVYAFTDADSVPDREGGTEKPRITQPVGQTEANPFGLHDLHGNVWEWTADYYQRDRGSEAVTDPTGPKSGDFRVIRGGGWDSSAAMCRSAARDRLMPGERRGNVGFRVVLAPIRAN